MLICADVMSVWTVMYVPVRRQKYILTMSVHACCRAYSIHTLNGMLVRRPSNHIAVKYKLWYCSLHSLSCCLRFHRTSRHAGVLMDLSTNAWYKATRNGCNIVSEKSSCCHIWCGILLSQKFYKKNVTEGFLKFYDGMSSLLLFLVQNQLISVSFNIFCKA